MTHHTSNIYEVNIPVTCSVIIPTIGRETLGRALQSVLSQNLTNSHTIEVIIVYDADRRPGDSAVYSDPRVHTIRTNHAGLCFACNAGAAVARGKYIKILHDDDWLIQDGLESLITAAETEGSGWVTGSARLVNDEGDQISVLPADQHLSGNLVAFFLIGEALHVSQTLFRRDTFLSVGGFDPTITIFEDRDLGWRIASMSSFGAVTNVVSAIRRSGGSSSAFDWTRDRHNSHLIRDRLLDSRSAWQQVIAGSRRDGYMRGRVARAVIGSLMHCLRAGDGLRVIHRIWQAARIICTTPPSVSLVLGLMGLPRR